MLSQSVFLLLSLPVLTLCARNNTGESRLFNDIIWNNNPYERPRYNKSHLVTVQFDFDLRSVSQFNEAQQQLECTGWLEMTWTDEFLTWTPSLYDGTESIRPPVTYIWKPDIVAANSFQQLNSLGGNFVSLKLYSNGFVQWSPGDIFSIPCDVDIQRYPFDSLVCYLELMVWSHADSEVDLKPMKSSAGIDQLKATGQWSLISNPTIASNPYTSDNETISRVIITLNLDRAPTNFVFSFIMPVSILALLGTFVFLIPSDSGEKISFAIIIPLSYGVYLSFLTTLVPQTSNGISIFIIFLGLTLLQSAMFVILSIYTVRVSRRESSVPIPNIYLKITLWVEAIKRFGRHQKITNTYDHNNQSGTTQTQLESMTWLRVSEALDLLFFWIFCLPIIIAIPSMMIFVTN